MTPECKEEILSYREKLPAMISCRGGNGDYHAGMFDTLLAELERLQEVNDALTALKSGEMKFEPGHIEGQFSAWFVPLFAEMLIHAFDSDGGVNYVEWGMNEAQGDYRRFTLTMQKVNGETPAQQLALARVELEQAKQELAAAQDALAQYKAWCAPCPHPERAGMGHSIYVKQTGDIEGGLNRDTCDQYCKKCGARKPKETDKE